MKDTVDVLEINAEEEEVQFERVHLFLVLFVPFLVLCSKFAHILAQSISKLVFKPTAKEKELLKTTVELKKEMSSLSMVDEFAKYAKIQRRLNLINLDLEATAGSRQTLQSQVNQVTKVCCHLILGLITAATVYTYRNMPVFIVPENWFYPISKLLAYPTGIPGAVSIITWIFLVRNISTVILAPNAK